MVKRIISGVAKKDLPHLHKETLSDYVNAQEPFSLYPLSNLDFMRDPVTVIEVPSSKLSRGRGGPRCMSIPLLRDAQPHKASDTR